MKLALVGSYNGLGLQVPGVPFGCFFRWVAIGLPCSGVQSDAARVRAAARPDCVQQPDDDLPACKHTPREAAGGEARMGEQHAYGVDGR